MVISKIVLSDKVKKSLARKIRYISDSAKDKRKWQKQQQNGGEQRKRQKDCGETNRVDGR
ncbi:hypothetical protein AB6F62_16560 [Providencia huaxiensis]|uniref:hypothetical protein n=1 Tax=Providencia huaxiensis TaxID=2027290 RepID=UPI0034DD29F6